MAHLQPSIAQWQSSRFTTYVHIYVKGKNSEIHNLRSSPQTMCITAEDAFTSFLIFQTGL